MNFLIKSNRLTAWILLVCMILLLISGYGMTKGIISAGTASKLHLGLLNIITLFVFVVHSSVSIYFALKRWGMWNVFTKITLVLFFSAFFGYFVYVDRFYKIPAKSVSSAPTTSTSTVAPSSSTNTTAPADTSTSTAEKTFTASTLAQFDGQNGQPAYVAVDGVVYDMSSVFRNGTHYGFDAGQDQSSVFHSKHYDSILSGYTVVGKLVQ
ncbi:MAG: hypothetical protein WC227_00840 [Patescibacteria group bacterium]|jgi:predicted heme/steroid binding protein